jgi:hopanoid biosynthesis associated protein HpnK
MARCLIVNADDFGMSRPVNDGIVEAHRDGLVTSVSLMANGPAFEDAVEQLQALPRLGVGVHLSLVGGEPVGDPQTVPTMLNRRGAFLGGWPAFIMRYLAGGIDLGELEREAAAQIERVLEAGIVPDHLDSHQHLHMLPGVFERIHALAQRYRVPVMRVPREPVVDLRGDLARPWGLARRQALRGVIAAQVGVCMNGVRSVNACWGVADSCRLTTQRLLRFLRAVPEGASELICHPGTGRGEPGDRPRELAALTSPSAREAVRAAGITLTTFAAWSGFQRR